MLSLSTMASDNYKSHDPSYAAHNQWSHMQGYASAGSHHNTPPMTDYQSYDFSPPPPTSMSMDMPYHMGRPSNYPPPHQQHQQLPPLAIQQPMNQQIWPSMLTGGPPPPPPSYQTPILPAAPIQTPVSAVSTTTEGTPTSATKGSSSRRKLTDDERRKMCIEAATNPNMKQTQIGLKFGVERSTVSKILRQKEKYMNPQQTEGSSSPTKKSKTKFPDIERALINWARNEERKGVAITDDKLKKQALFFSSTFGNSDNHSHLTSDAWLSRFKQKNLLVTGKKSKSGSRDFSGVAVVDSSTTSYTDGLDHSPVSSASGLVSPPLSLEEDELHHDAKHSTNDDFFDFGDRHVGHAMSLGEVVSPDLEAGGAVLSPLSPDMQQSGSVTASTAGMEENLPAYSSAYSRQRSQTFPHFQAEEAAHSRPSSSGRHTPLPVRSMTTSVAPQDLHVNPREMMKRSESVPNIRDASAIYMSSMKPPPLPKSERNSPVLPGSPTQEEARRALYTLKSFFQAQPSDMLDMDDWTSIGNMMRKLKVQRSGEDLPGGMVPLDILDDPRPMKKRTILGIST